MSFLAEMLLFPHIEGFSYIYHLPTEPTVNLLRVGNARVHMTQNDLMKSQSLSYNNSPANHSPTRSSNLVEINLKFLIAV